MRIFNWGTIALSSLLVGLAQTSATAFTLDAFSDFEGNNTNQNAFINNPFGGGDSPTNTDSNLSTTNVFGGQRTISVFNKNSGSNLILLNIVNGEADFSAGASTIGGSEIAWDGWQNSTTNFRNIEDDNGATQRSFQVNIASLDIGQGDTNITFNFDIEDTSGNLATISQALTKDIPSTTSIYFPYQNRVESTNDAGGNVNLQQINYIKFYTSNENVGDDFVFNFIQSSERVPFEFSPSLGLILGGSLFGFLNLQKKLKKRQSSKL